MELAVLVVGVQTEYLEGKQTYGNTVTVMCSVAKTRAECKFSWYVLK